MLSLVVPDKKESISHKLVYCIIYTMHRTGESIMILSEVMFISAWREPNKYRGWGEAGVGGAGPGDLTITPTARTIPGTSKKADFCFVVDMFFWFLGVNTPPY